MLRATLATLITATGELMNVTGVTREANPLRPYRLGEG